MGEDLDKEVTEEVFKRVEPLMNDISNVLLHHDLSTSDEISVLVNITIQKIYGTGLSQKRAHKTLTQAVLSIYTKMDRLVDEG